MDSANPSLTVFHLEVLCLSHSSHHFYLVACLTRHASIILHGSTTIVTCARVPHDDESYSIPSLTSTLSTFAIHTSRRRCWRIALKDTSRGICVAVLSSVGVSSCSRETQRSPIVTHVEAQCCLMCEICSGVMVKSEEAGVREHIHARLSEIARVQSPLPLTAAPFIVYR